tara:strand:+ start:3581 stop:3835 length:255 start_codon:yes stop_codon:yes gene_type:complete
MKFGIIKGDWRDKLKNDRIRPPMIQTYVNFIKDNPGKTVFEIQGWAQRNMKKTIKTKRLRALLELHPNVQISYSSPKKYNYRDV